MSNQNNQFQQYNLSNQIIEALNILKYHVPTKIQEQVIPTALEGKDLVGKSKTGSGKTAAFAIPICEQAVWEVNSPSALVIEPTRELTVQVKQEIHHIGRMKRLKVADVFGGFPIDKQIQTLKQKNHIVVGTPGRIMDHIRRESIDLSNIRTVIIDEADLMLDMGFIDEMKEIFTYLPKQINTMFFSATIDEKLEIFIREYMKDPIYITIEEEESTENKIKQILYAVENEGKYEMFRNLLIAQNPESCMIFCATREMVNVLCRMLRKDGIKCGMIHGEIDQQDRIRTVEAFREGQIHYLIATDVVARGIDFDHLSHVFNYDFPTGRETYVHRIGRTGRNGQTGTAISLVSKADEKMLQMIEEYTGWELPLATFEPASREAEEAFWNRQKEKKVRKKKKGADFNRTITKLSIGGGKKSKMRAGDIVGAICNIEGVLQEDIGAIDVRESLTYVEILNKKGDLVHDALQNKNIKGKVRKVHFTKL